MKKIITLLAFSTVLVYADHFIEASSEKLQSKPTQNSVNLSPLDKKIMELRKSAKNGDMGFFVDARSGKVLGSASAGLPKGTIQKKIYNKPTTAKNTESKNKVKYDMSVEKIPLM